MVLNIVTQSFTNNKILTIIKQNSILLIQDGIYLGLDLVNINNIYALEQDVITRGLINHYPKNIILIDYNKFVDLVIKHQKIITY